ncbi:sulfurtransferase [Paenibacillus albiflavus]|uniref:Sulfurtransferase n=1 Tax=Paenibacillus albiflavus TaxID=2545760 RepID=A0A4R4EFQ8_9BACL|nr:sulfurtransferase [Paenibacillus albiflavus]TCZ78906.1 sulfurtransferase [Paenibacillus albiflavus]
MKSIVSPEWLAEHLEDSNLVIVDCRFILGQPDFGGQAYAEDHIAGAYYLVLNKDLSGPIREHGGRHPLPDLGTLSLRFGSIGIDASKVVVAYDDQGGMNASRLWWLLQFLNHQEVYVLDRGYSSWKAAGYPISSEVPATVDNVTFSPKVQRQMLASVDEVRDKLGRAGTILIDSREERRYLGLEEAIDRAAGHIPGARNYFWKGVLTEDGAWAGSEIQAERFQAINKEDEVIVYCGSGVSACPNVIALHEAGFPKVKLYSGSWSDWISYEDNPIATGEE